MTARPVLFVAVLAVGCISIERPSATVPGPPVESVTLAQEGNVTTGMDDRTVYYPVPYISPPNLEVVPVGGQGHIWRIDQRADRFIVSATGCTIEWKARGLVPKSCVADRPASSFAATPSAGPIE